MLEKETKLEENQGMNYRRKVVGILTLTASHFTSPQVSQIMELDFSQLQNLFKQNARLPKPYDWDKYVDHPELRSRFYHRKKVKTSKKKSVIKLVGR